MASCTDSITDPILTNQKVATISDLITSSERAEPEVTLSPAERVLLNSALLHSAKQVNKHLTPFIVVLGYFGNISMILTMNRPSMKKSSSSVYFIALALADLLVLTNHIMFNWVEDSFPPEEHYWLKNDQLCKLRHFTLMYGLVWSGMTLVALTGERFIVTVFPFRGKILCTRKNAKIVVFTIALVFGVIWIVLIWRFDPKWGPCTNDDLLDFLFDGGLWFTTTMYTYVPTPVLLTLNGILAVHLIKARTRRESLTNSLSVNTLRKGSVKNGSRFTRLTITAMAVSVAYLVLTLPTSTVNIYGKMYLTQQGGLYSPELLFAHNICLMLRLLNHAINFLLYFVTSPKLRSEFCELVTCFLCRNGSSQSVNSERAPQTARPQEDDVPSSPHTLSETVEMQEKQLQAG